MQGVIQAYLTDKKFGFIKGDDGKDYFFHESKFKHKSHIANICDQAVVKFEQHATPKGYQARSCELVNPSDVLTYIVPDAFFTTKKSTINKWEIIEEGEWLVSSSSSESPDAARKQVIERAMQVGANALVDLEYSKSTGSDGNYQFSIHHFYGKVVTIAKRNSLGDYKFDDLAGLNQRADKLKRELIDQTERHNKSKSRTHTFIWVFAIVFSLFFAAAGAGAYSFIPVAISFFISLKSSNESFDSWLEKLG